MIAGQRVDPYDVCTFKERVPLRPRIVVAALRKEAKVNIEALADLPDLIHRGRMRCAARRNDRNRVRSSEAGLDRACGNAVYRSRR
jgi:hypothetical protein